MADITISDDALRDIKDKIIIITGGSSGIGRATAQLCVDLGAQVVIGDINPPKPAFASSENPKFFNVDVTQWESQREMFMQTEKLFGRIDHVFANAGIRPTPEFLEFNVDDAGAFQPPNLKTINVNLIGPIYTTHLACAYFAKFAAEKIPAAASIVLTASASSLQTFTSGDYTIAKHGVLGIMRGLVNKLKGEVRLNAVAPSWTDTGIISADLLKQVGVTTQPPEAVARSVAFLFADSTRHGDVIYSWDSQFREVNNAPGGLLEAAENILPNVASEESVMGKVLELFRAQAEEARQKA
ncbi:hypothetical protein N7468_004298 [Penicillium chermesinum]|uniref:Uncharacterized protein n=1 Tax=Penicillium chermesinum TaxID=63820 RepID=A0A9W9TU72_9EURO|nr:uncharacterized protein N7468_004298 [Penicillium chermesinum]KAJ5239679.1 hypothetical protein N7468_004298 [Penicillium chermesinum]KAJ6166567.1 hypothetical protein N7470_002014 [Penicillium chermesinum]